MIGREVLFEEVASANYHLRQVKHRRTGTITWEVLDASSGLTVLGGLTDRQEALRRTFCQPQLVNLNKDTPEWADLIRKGINSRHISHRKGDVGKLLVLFYRKSRK